MILCQSFKSVGIYGRLIRRTRIAFHFHAGRSTSIW